MTEHHVELRISLAALQGSAQRELQKLVDILELLHAGIRLVCAEHYPASPDFLAVYPSSNTRLPLDAARSEADLWLTSHCLLDAIEALAKYLEEARRVCAVYRLAHRGKTTVGEFQSTSARDVRFHRLGLPDKIAHLERVYGVASSNTPLILSINTARNCFVHRDGVVTSMDLNDGDFLTVRWASMHLEAESADGLHRQAIQQSAPIDAGTMLHLVVGPSSKSFRVPENVTFTYRELVGIVWTHLVFVNDIAGSIQRFAEGLGFTFPPPAA